MTIRGAEGMGAGTEVATLDLGPIVATSAMEAMTASLLETERTSEEAEREMALAARARARSESAAMVAHTREAADWALAQGVASGVMTMASAGAKAAGTAAASSASSARSEHGETATAEAGGVADAEIGDTAGPDGSATAAGSDGPDRGAAPERARPNRPAVDPGWDAVAQGLGGAGDVAGAGLGALAGEARAAEAAARAVADDARSRAEELRSAAEASSAAQERLMEAYARIVGEKRRAEEAATRA